MHRKLTAPSFGEKNNELVFVESVHHANSMLRLWTGPDGSGNRTINDPATDTMKFALFVISRAGFDVRVAWPHEEKEIAEGGDSEADAFFTGSKPPPGHEMNYRQALSSLLENIMWTQIAPPEYLSESSCMSSPFHSNAQGGVNLEYRIVCRCTTERQTGYKFLLMDERQPLSESMYSALLRILA
jgi:hypothetical protein